MMRSVQKSLWLLAFAVVLVCGIYPESYGALAKLSFRSRSMAASSTGPTVIPSVRSS